MSWVRAPSVPFERCAYELGIVPTKPNRRHFLRASTGNYIFKAVTDGVSYVWLNMHTDIPCGKDMFYDRYRRFFWLLDGVRR